ncbi:MAG: hypothetical protein P8046_14345 [Anaerolineales bacterium]
MAKTKTLRNGNIKVTFDEDGVDVISEAVPTPPSSKSFTIIKALGNIFFFTKNTDHKQKSNQRDKFTNQVTLEIPLTQDVINHPAVKAKGLGALKLVYYDKNQGEWFAFKKQSMDEEAKVGRAQFNDWIKDPPVGWGDPITT